MILVFKILFSLVFNVKVKDFCLVVEIVDPPRLRDSLAPDPGLSVGPLSSLLGILGVIPQSMPLSGDIVTKDGPPGYPERGNTRGPTQIQLAIPEDNKRATPTRKRHETNHYQRYQRVADSGERMRYTPVA